MFDEELVRVGECYVRPGQIVAVVPCFSRVANVRVHLVNGAHIDTAFGGGCHSFVEALALARMDYEGDATATRQEDVLFPWEDVLLPKSGGEG